MDDRKLMPCPLCGGENVEHSVYADRGNQNIVRCLDCGCRVSSQFGGCIDTWNHRNALTQRAAAPEGWKLVPVEPTEAVLVAALQEVDPLGELIDWDSSRGDCNTRRQVADIYRAMLAATPQEDKP